MVSRSVPTQQGIFRLDEPDDAALLALKVWPKPIFAVEECGRKLWGITMEDAEGEILGLRVNYGYYETEKDAAEIVQIQRWLLPSAICEYLKYGFGGIQLPCVYLAGQSGRAFLTGHALFGRSFGHSGVGFRFEPVQGYEEDFGVGSTNMLLSFIAAAHKAWGAVQFPPRTITDLDEETISTCGRIWFDFLVSGERLFCLKKDIRDDDPTWSNLMKGGITRVCHLPAVPVTLSRPGERPA